MEMQEQKTGIQRYIPILAALGSYKGDWLRMDIVAALSVWALLVPQSILFEAALSYLGLGLPPDQASLGELLAETAQLYNVAWWITVSSATC